MRLPSIEGAAMMRIGFVLTAVLVTVIAVGAVAAKDIKDKVKVEIDSVGLHPGMDPGMYVCAGGHLHIKGTVQNLSDAPLRHVKVAARAYDAEGKLLGTATATTKGGKIGPREKSEINMEFLSVTGPAIQRVKRHEVTVVEAPST
jgi:hypothetical protein